MKKQLGYTSEEMKTFRANPKNEHVVSKAPELSEKMIVAEVIRSHGCNSQHKTGDKLYFDSAGNLLTKHSPERVCVYALKAIAPQIFAMGELLLAGADPNQMRFKQAACFDVGLECGGWGQIVMDVKTVDRKELD